MDCPLPTNKTGMILDTVMYCITVSNIIPVLLVGRGQYITVSNIIPVLLVGRGQYITVSNIIPVLLVGRGQYITVSNIIPQLCTVLSLQIKQE
jgi:hypothetical protein